MFFGFFKKKVGRNVPAIWQGMIGLIASLEGFYGAESSDPRRVTFFLLILFPCVAVSCTLGTLAITGSEVLVNCNPAAVTVFSSNSTTTVKSTASFEQCNTSFKVYGFVELLGGAAIGLLILIVVAISLRKLRVEAAEFDAKQADMELIAA
jgi:hypothetical protein